MTATTLCQAFQQTAAQHADRVALRTLGGAVEITWGEYAARVRRIAAGLYRLGVRRHDTVALMMTNRPEFHLVDTAAIHLGAVPFSVYNTLPPDQIRYLLSNAGNKVAICEARFLPVVEAASRETAVEHIICIDADEGPTSLVALEAGEARGFDFEAAWRAVEPADLVTLIYTSGTTGPPKGVELTHANIIAELEATASFDRATAEDRTISYLPAAHIADRWGSHYCGIAFGTEVTSIPDPKMILMALQDARPTVFGAVPRVWERMKAMLELRMAQEPDEQRKMAAAWAIGVGKRKVQAEQAHLRGEGAGPDEALLAEYGRADALVLSRVRELIGLDRTRWLVSGAAPIAAEVLEFFGALGLPIHEVWGMSETSCVVTVNPPGRAKLGTVGLPVAGSELSLAPDGELLVRGPLVMRGYRDEPGRTDEAIDGDGWLHTGDIARIDRDGYVTIVDRKKEIIINAAGKNMSPANIENTLKASSLLIGQAVCIGDRRPFNVALLVLDPEAVKAYPSSASIEAAVAEAVKRANERLSRVEQVKRYRVLPAAWEPGGDELTPTMKLKRKPIAQKYEAEIEAMYEDPAAASG